MKSAVSSQRVGKCHCDYNSRVSAVLLDHSPVCGMSFKKGYFQVLSACLCSVPFVVLFSGEMTGQQTLLKLLKRHYH